MKNIEFNTQICTTIEQSKRLLELGLGADTSDMFYSAKHIGKDIVRYSDPQMLVHNDHFEIFVDDQPAWSLHRLIAMLPNVIYTTILSVSINYPDIKLIDFEHNSIEYLGTSGCRMFYKNKGKYALYNNIIDCIEWLIQEGHFNKEYLKEK